MFLAGLAKPQKSCVVTLALLFAGQRLFLDDLADRLLVTSEGQRQLAYPYPDVLSCVEGLFMSGGSSAAATRAKLALLLYYLLDGGWLASAVPFAHVRLTLLQF
jgi:hypothetical protein